MTKSVKISVIVLVLLSATVLFAVSNLSGNSLYYFTVDQYVAKQQELGKRFVQVKGKVVPGSIQYDPVALDLSFDIEENGKRLHVLYRNLKPDALNDGIEVVAAGRNAGDGVFQAKDLTVKCPSRYISADQQKGGSQSGAGGAGTVTPGEGAGR